MGEVWGCVGGGCLMSRESGIELEVENEIRQGLRGCCNNIGFFAKLQFCTINIEILEMRIEFA